MSAVVKLRTRPRLDRERPNRTPGHFYRAAVDNPDVLGGVPLDSVESAVTAAVRLGYKVASAQIDRTARIARRFRDAGDQAAGVRRDKGESSERKALDASEQLIFKALMAGLGWLEGVAADNGNPVRRIAAAQFQMLGAMLGLSPEPAASAPSPPPDQPGPGDGSALPAGQAARSSPRPRRRVPQVRHAPANGHLQARRVVRIQDWDLASEATGDYPVTFYRDAGAGTLDGDLSVSRGGGVVLTMKTTAKAEAGLYKAAVCDKTGLQLGYVEILL
jgi:hypothetical protein